MTAADNAVPPGDATHLPGGMTLSSGRPRGATLPGMSVADPPSLQNRLLLRLCAVFVAFFLAAGLVVFLIYHTDSAEIPFDVLTDDQIGQQVGCLGDGRPPHCRAVLALMVPDVEQWRLPQHEPRRPTRRRVGRDLLDGQTDQP